MSENGVKLSLWWPEALPAPTVEGNEATYSEVYPGVDLKMASVGTSFTQRLVVKTRAAGANPKVRDLTLKASVAGGTLAASGLGYVVKDPLGVPALTGSQPVMWDNGAAAKGAGATEELDEGDRPAPIGLSVAKASLGLSANAAMLDDPSTVFPVVLDPTGSPTIYNWAMVNKTHPTLSFYNFTSSDEGVGYNNFEGVHTKRIYYSFPTSSYNSSTIISATLYAYETYSATCSAGTVNAYLTNTISSSTTWNNQPSKIISGALDGWSTKAGRPDCYPGGKTASWTVTSGVKNRVAAGASRSTFVLQGSSETSYASWMRFGGPKNSTTSYRPKLSVTYNKPPYTVALSSMFVPTSSKACTGYTSASTGPVINPTTGASDAMSAKISDPNGDSLTSTLELRTSGGTLVSSTSFTAKASGSTITKTVPSTLANGVYKFRVQAKDSYVAGSWSAYCYFTVDTTKPTVTITSPTWPEGVLAPADATAGTFVMTAPGAADIAFRWNSVATATHATPNSSGQVTKTTTMTRTLDYWRAQASSAAGTAGNTDTYYVKRTQPAKLAEYLFNAPSPLADTATTQLDSSSPLSDPDAAAAYGFDLAAGFDSFDDVGRYDTPAALFDGSGATASVPSRPVVSERSFTVGAWVYMVDRDQSRTVVSQLLDADPADPTAPRLTFDLGYDIALDKFVARVMDGSGTVLTQATDNLPSHIGGNPANADLTRDGSWVYLAMVYDSTAGTLRLDANHSGNADPPNSDFSTLYKGTAVTGVGPVGSSQGEFLIGGGSSAQGDRAGWYGLVDNLAVWQGVPSDATILLNANNHQ